MLLPFLFIIFRWIDSFLGAFSVPFGSFRWIFLIFLLNSAKLLKVSFFDSFPTRFSSLRVLNSFILGFCSTKVAFGWIFAQIVEFCSEFPPQTLIFSSKCVNCFTKDALQWFNASVGFIINKILRLANILFYFTDWLLPFIFTFLIIAPRGFSFTTNLFLVACVAFQF